MRISDWSSDVCSSDLPETAPVAAPVAPPTADVTASVPPTGEVAPAPTLLEPLALPDTPPDAPPPSADAAPFRVPDAAPVSPASVLRSEEHTSELQSLMRISYAVFCLKKKKQNSTPPNAYSNSERKRKRLNSTH